MAYFQYYAIFKSKQFSSNIRKKLESLNQLQTLCLPLNFYVLYYSGLTVYVSKLIEIKKKEK